MRIKWQVEYIAIMFLEKTNNIFFELKGDEYIMESSVLNNPIDVNNRSH